MSTTPKILCIGNPLLDISTHVEMTIFEKYGLQLNNAILADEKHLPLYKEIIETGTVEYIPGGAAQNSARVCQWMLNTPHTVCYTGCVGKDANGKILADATAANGVLVRYQEDPVEPTGACAVLINKKERSLCTSLGAANKFNISHLQTDVMQSIIKGADFFYMVGYFLTVSPDSAMYLAKHAAEQNKAFIYGLAAPFLIQVPFFFERVSALLPYCDIVFSNESEAEVLGTKMGWGTDLKVIAEKLAQWEKVNSKRSRIVVFTQGADSTIVYDQGKISTYQPIKLDSDKIVDLNAAGDSFSGGFLAAYSLGKSIEKCCEAGHYAAMEIIQQNGCSFPSKRSFDLE
ncbi:adenosine kinase [Tieghemostelium lacteum]|uniref:Adenosine kinase n=1 Tax=Tieghemostelium lacteum TaxID=361077 RepID=A0A151Z984_TIELA|nr:adenosine kinase [Tieghemostelium lacteum]|eukprot:KYQ90508.1 adenosine kinase [Tieghemostelium lacteum]